MDATDPSAPRHRTSPVISPAAGAARASPVLDRWATSTFSRAGQPYRRCSAAPHFAPGAFLGKPRGLPRLNDPPHAGGAAPRPGPRTRSSHRARNRRVSYTKRLTYWVDSADRERMDDCRVHYRLDEERTGKAQLLVEG